MQIAELRKKAGLTQKELSDLTHISIWTIRSYEQETRDINCIELKKAVDLATALGVKAEDLITR